MAALLLLSALVFGGAVFLVLEELGRARREAFDPRRRIDPYVRPLAAAPAHVRRPGRVRAALAQLSRRVLPGRSESALANQIEAAGLGGRFSTPDVLALELVVAATLAAAGFLIGAGRSTGQALVLGLLLGTAGLLMPRYMLRLRARRRVEQIRAELPDALDILAVTVRAGLGLDAAMARVAEMTDGPLADELTRVLQETRIGESRTRALERFAARLGARDVTAFVRALVQGDQLGTSLGETLRIQAVEARRRRRTASEERANKASVKMIFPTAIFIFPALFVVILAPAILSFTGQL